MATNIARIKDAQGNVLWQGGGSSLRSGIVVQGKSWANNLVLKQPPLTFILKDYQWVHIMSDGRPHVEKFSLALPAPYYRTQSKKVYHGQKRKQFYCNDPTCTVDPEIEVL